MDTMWHEDLLIQHLGLKRKVGKRGALLSLLLPAPPCGGDEGRHGMNNKKKSVICRILRSGQINGLLEICDKWQMPQESISEDMQFSKPG
ncbi:unnamed protein product [Gadus morhua 'NCC']